MTATGDETIRLASDSTWVTEYDQALALTGLGATSRQVVVEDSCFIADRAALGVEDSRWGRSRVRTGVVMGAVQSGKTASMIGVAARSLDNGVNVVVVLAGTQVSLWQQSMNRIRSQLDSGPRRMLRRVFLPGPTNEDVGRRPGPSTAYSLTSGQAERALKVERPIIVVAMKQVDHLLHLGQMLHTVIYRAAEQVGVPIRLLVIDDEADDSSIADDGVQWGSPELELYKQVPRRIVDLWESRSQPGLTVSPHVFATYLAYTATPQANFLQDPDNPLAPRDFVASLRTPGPEGAKEPRSLTYRVPEGLRGWYTGSEFYYGPLAPMLCITEGAVEAENDQPEFVAQESAETSHGRSEIITAVRAYLVAAALRLARARGRMGPTTAKCLTLGTSRAVSDAIAPVSTMLIHPSSTMESHFEVAQVLRSWWRGAEGPSGGVERDVAEHATEWVRWVESYEASANSVADEYDLPGAANPVRSVPSWADVRRLLLEEVIPGTTIAVVNSDPGADERPSFEPWQDAHGWHAPRNHSTIFVSGNVMSRGLTLEGLLTTLFTRSVNAPLADTQMQMQRWFGYRGAYVDLCRVFLSPAQLSLFTQYADADHALRSQVLAAMEQSPETLPNFTVLEGHTFHATGKVSGLQSRQLRPGSRPFVSHLNPPGADEENLDLVARHIIDARRRGQLHFSPRGVVGTDTLSLLEVAHLLDGLTYVDHGRVAFEEGRWRALESQARLRDGDPEFPLYRAPPIHVGGIDLGARSPYVIAAYLRFWSACLDRRVRGVLTDDQPPQRWSLLNLSSKSALQPKFRVGVRFGKGPPISSGPFEQLASILGQEICPMDRAIEGTSLAADWGSRKATETGFAGDDLFDLALLGERPRLDPDGTRAEGSPGLVLFHLLRREGERGGIAVGLSIPAGGPDHVEAASTTRRRKLDG